MSDFPENQPVELPDVSSFINNLKSYLDNKKDIRNEDKDIVFRFLAINMLAIAAGTVSGSLPRIVPSGDAGTQFGILWDEVVVQKVIPYCTKDKDLDRKRLNLILFQIAEKYLTGIGHEVRYHIMSRPAYP